MKNKESIRNDYRWEETNNYMDLEVGSRNGKKISVGGKNGRNWNKVQVSRRQGFCFVHLVLSLRVWHVVGVCLRHMLSPAGWAVRILIQRWEGYFQVDQGRVVPWAAEKTGLEEGRFRRFQRSEKKENGERTPRGSLPYLVTQNWKVPPCTHMRTSLLWRCEKHVIPSVSEWGRRYWDKTLHLTLQERLHIRPWSVRPFPAQHMCFDQCTIH